METIIYEKILYSGKFFLIEKICPETFYGILNYKNVIFIQKKKISEKFSMKFVYVLVWKIFSISVGKLHDENVCLLTCPYLGLLYIKNILNSIIIKFLPICIKFKLIKSQNLDCSVKYATIFFE